jgi:putative adhesin
MSRGRRYFIALIPALVTAGLLSASISNAQETKDVSYSTGPRSLISITNNYGAVTVKASGNRQVLVRTVSYSSDVSFENEQHRKRIALRSVSQHPGTALAEYAVLVPVDSFVVIVAAGPIHVEGLNGDLVMQTGNAIVDVKQIDSAHVHIRTLNGAIALSDIRNSHVDVHSVNGNVNIRDVTQSWIDVDSVRGQIQFEGDPREGEYLLSSHSGDLELSIPATALADISSHSGNEQSDRTQQETGLSSSTARNLLLKRGSLAMPRFILRSLSGKIRVKRP